MKSLRPARNSSPHATEPQRRRPLQRVILFFLAFAFAIALIIGLTGLLIYNSFSRPRHEGKAVAPGVTIAPFVTLPGEDVFPMGLAAASDGTFYLTLFGTGAVLRVDAKGATTPLIEPGQLKAASAAVVGPDSALYVMDASSTNPYQAVATLRRVVTSNGSLKVEAFGVSPNGNALPIFAQMAFDSAGNLYVTNPAFGEVWQISPSGSSVVWWTAPSVAGTRAQPTGIAFDRARNALVIGDAGTGSVYRLDLGTSSPPGNPYLLYRQPGLELHGLTLDDQGRVLLNAWAHDNGQLIRLEGDGSLTVLAEGFRAPTAIIYQSGKAYIVNSDLLGLAPPLLFGLIPSPLQAKPPFTIDVVDLSASSAPPPKTTPSRALLLIS